MFRFLELELHGWDFWPPVRVPLDADVVVLSGPNGSGKTTMLDAIRQVLHAPRLSQGRRVSHYLRQPNQPALLRAVVSNRADGRGRRPFERERIFADEATLACALVPDGGTPEKRFAVLSGRVPARELQERLLDRREFRGPDEYRRILDYAGVSRSLMHILALEQGRADELSRQKPRELFRWVMEARGSQQVLDRYTAARRRFEESEREVARQRAQVARYEADLLEVERKVRRLEEHGERRARVAHAEALVTASRLQARLLEAREADRKLPGLRAQAAHLVTTVERLAREIAADEQGLVDLTGEAGRRQEAAHAATGACDAAIARHATLESEVGTLRDQAAEFARLPEEDAAALEAALALAREAAFAAGREHDRLAAEVRDVEARIADLEKGIPRFPAEVERALAALEQEGIAAALVASRVEVREPDWAPAVESALGSLRYALCVAREDEARATVIARAHGFPGPLVCDLTDAPAAAGPLDFVAGVPGWLGAWGRAVQLVDGQHPPEGEAVLARDGTRRDRHGLWVSRVPDRVLGGGAVRAQLEAAHEAHARLLTACDQAERDRDAATARIADLEGRLAVQRRRQALAPAVARLPEWEAALAESAARATDARRTRDEAHEALRKAELAAGRAEAALARKREDLAAREKELEGTRGAVAEHERKLAALEPEIEAVGRQVEPVLRARAEAGALSTEEMAARDLTLAQEALRRFEAEGPIPDESVRDERKVLQRNLDDLHAHVRARQAEADAARAELDLCRGEYLHVVRSTLHDYARRARTLAELASAKIEVELPQLENDDRSIDEAGIVVRIGFDGKPPTELSDTAHSGGQQVVAGLVLLMAMAETEGESFFIVDEPFAHLSLDRVDDVGKFLRRSGAQFLITVPTTLDRGQLDPASLVIVLRKKGPDVSSAPRPIVARA